MDFITYYFRNNLSDVHQFMYILEPKSEAQLQNNSTLVTTNRLFHQVMSILKSSFKANLHDN